MSEFTRFQGADKYIADEGLMADVNAAIALRRPLLVRGEPGTGKTSLAHAIAESLGMPLMTWHVKSTTSAKEGLYEYDVVQRLNDSRFGDGDVAVVVALVGSTVAPVDTFAASSAVLAATKYGRDPYTSFIPSSIMISPCSPRLSTR